MKSINKLRFFFNKKKLNSIWADKTTLDAIINDLKSNGLGVNDLCHGARNGYEVEYFRKHLDSEIIGTDISDTAENIPNGSIVLILYILIHLTRHSIPKRLSKLGYINLIKNGRIYIEHTIYHSPRGAGAMDPFGADPMVMPYLLFDWGKEIYSLEDIIQIPRKKNKNLKAWVFVLSGA